MAHSWHIGWSYRASLPKTLGCAEHPERCNRASFRPLGVCRGISLPNLREVSHLARSPLHEPSGHSLGCSPVGLAGRLGVHGKGEARVGVAG